MEGAAVNRRLVGLAAVAALLGGYLAYEGFGPAATGQVGDAALSDAAAPRAVTVKLNPLQDLDPDAYPDIVDRPLFNPSRQPRPADPVAPPPPPVVEQPVVEPPPPPPQGPGPDDYKLLGVSSGPDGRIAALRIAASGDVVYLRKGEGVDQWNVVDVGERSIVIGTAENPVTYSLFANTELATPGAGVQPGAAIPTQPLPLPLPLPMPQPKQPNGQPPLPEQHAVPDTGG
jgi:hypothetical protein